MHDSVLPHIFAGMQAVSRYRSPDNESNDLWIHEGQGTVDARKSANNISEAATITSQSTPNSTSIAFIEILLGL